MDNKNNDNKKIYINEIIRVNYKCNWQCSFCNVSKTNNYWNRDVDSKEVVHKIMWLTKKYSVSERKNLLLSFSWWEPTLNKNLINFIILAKKIWIGTIQIQTNWALLYNDKNYINKLIDVWLDEVFLAQHSWKDEVNKTLWCYFKVADFKSWVQYIKENSIHEKIWFQLNIVINKINLFDIYDYITLLVDIWFTDMLRWEISFWFIQLNWYAEINKKNLALKYNEKEIKEINKIIYLCKKNDLSLDFHFTAPPLCILDYPDYNLEYIRLKKLEDDKIKWLINEENLESYKYLWKEKQKLDDCIGCKNEKYCIGFYKNWMDYVWEDYVSGIINKYKNNNLIKKPILFINKDYIVDYFTNLLKQIHTNTLNTESWKLIIFFEKLIVIIKFWWWVQKNIWTIKKFGNFYNIPKIINFWIIKDYKDYEYIVQDRIVNYGEINNNDAIDFIIKGSHKSRTKISDFKKERLYLFGITNLQLDDSIKTLWDFLIQFINNILYEYSTVKTDKIWILCNHIISEIQNNIDLFSEEELYLIHWDMHKANLILDKDNNLYFIDYDSICYFDYYYDIVKYCTYEKINLEWVKNKFNLSEKRYKINESILNLYEIIKK
jgi:hypothetical protein